MKQKSVNEFFFISLKTNAHSDPPKSFQDSQYVNHSVTRLKYEINQNEKKLKPLKG